MTYFPDNWVILQIDYKGKTYYKLLCQVYPGMNGWRINSGITKVEKLETCYLVHGASNSIYQCDIEDELLSRCTAPILERVKGHAKVIPIENISKNFLLKQ